MCSLSGQKFDRGPLGVTWIHGSPSGEGNADPALQVHWHDEHTVLLRQSKAVHYEAPAPPAMPTAISSGGPSVARAAVRR
jgi:hypothetical protein